MKLSHWSLLLCVSLSATLFSAGHNVSDKEIQTRATAALQSSGNTGTEFYFTFIPCYEEAGNNKLMLYLTSTIEGYATIEVKSKGYNNLVKVKAYDVTPVELGPGFGQAFSKSNNGSIPPEQVYPGVAVHVTSTVPIVICAVTRFNYTSDSFLVLPVQCLGTDYIVASMADMTWMYGGYSLPSETSITAAYDSTRITFVLGGPAITKSGGGMRPGDTKTFTMNKGDVWVIGNDATSKEGDVSGSTITASKPVAVVSGNQCANVPTTLRWCDYISEMELPTSIWGTHLQLPRYTSRINGYFMKVFAKEPNTKVYYNGSYWKTIMTAGGSEGRGWIYQRVDGSGNNILSLSADNPISATVFNTGQEDDNVSTDPFQMGVLPVVQYQKSILFTTPGSKGGVGFTRNFMGIVFEVDAITNGLPADLEFGRAVKGEMVWSPLATVFGPSFLNKDIYQQKVNGKTYAYKECILTSDNVYAVRCSTPFGAYLYGGSDYDSYGHPAAIAGFAFNADSVAPTATYNVECDGSVGLKVPAYIEDLPRDTTRSNLSQIFLQPGVSTNYKLVLDSLQSGVTARTSWRATVIDRDKDAHAIVIFSDRAGNQASITLDYKAALLSILKKEVNFGISAKGTLVSQDVDIKNISSTDIIVTRLDMKNGGNGVYGFATTPPLPLKLLKGEALTIRIQFQSSKTGEFHDSLGVGSECRFEYQSDIVAVSSEPSSVEDPVNENSLIQLSPNPADKDIHITLNPEIHDVRSLELVDVRGLVVSTLDVPEAHSHTQSFTIPTAQLAAGTYRCIVHCGQGVLRRSVVVAH